MFPRKRRMVLITGCVSLALIMIHASVDLSFKQVKISNKSGLHTSKCNMKEEMGCRNISMAAKSSTLVSNQVTPANFNTKFISATQFMPPKLPSFQHSTMTGLV